jgi:hypothetical protein
VRALKKAGISEWSIPLDLSRSIRSSLRSSIKGNYITERALQKATVNRGTFLPQFKSVKIFFNKPMYGQDKNYFRLILCEKIVISDWRDINEISR